MEDVTVSAESRENNTLDAAGFDRITQSLAQVRSRRAFIASALAMALATLTLGGSGQHLDVEARKKRKKRKKRRKRKQRQTQTPAELQFNEFGCIDVGAPCRGNSDYCCSGICEGPAPNPGEQDTSRCVAHHVATCLVGQSACDAAGVDCGVEGFCYTTTGKAGFCGAKANLCRDCKKDKDCEEEFGAGAACLSCLDCGIGGTACAAAAG